MFLGQGSCKLGGTQGRRLQVMPHLQAEVPDPLRNDLPALLTASGMRTPASGVLFDILIGKSRLKGAAMQIQRDDIGGAERLALANE